MKNATLRQLKVFEAVARNLNFSRAAEELHLTQPAVSTQVRKLEEHAGLPLFEQLGKKTYMTPAGAEMLAFSRAVIARFRDAEEAMAQFKSVAGGRLSVAVISAGDYFFPRLLVEFARRHPGVTLDFAVHNRAGLLEQLEHNRVDLAVMVRPPVGMDTINEPFAPHPYVVVAPPGHPLVAACRIALARIVREPFIVREKGSDTWNSMEQGFGGWLARLNVFMEITSTETIKQAVTAGMGLSFLSAHTVRRELREGSLVALDVAGFPLLLNWYVVHRRNKRLPPVAQAFREFLLRDAPALVEEDAGVAAPHTPARRGARVRKKT